MSTAREFDEGEVVDQALLAFWRLGYDACSISDLVEATGVHRQSLYNAFGDKKSLFLAAAARYRALSAASLGPLRSPRAGIADIRRYFERFLQIVHDKGCGACLLVQTSFTIAGRDAKIRELIHAASADVRAAFITALENAVRTGELSRKTDIPAQAAYLFCVLHGLSALAQSGATRKQVADAMSQALRNLR
jgi:TetR/AcrR family transcriptional repressor of nem operon